MQHLHRENVVDNRMTAKVSCPRCGAKMPVTSQVCSSCERELLEETRQKIIELLRIQPWISYDECRQYIPCTEWLFEDVKESIKKYYFEQVISGTADEYQKRKAVLLLKEIPPEDITEEIYNQAISEFRYYQTKRKFVEDKADKEWREKHVSTSRSRLYGKK